jgi:cystathionine beta-lyase
MPPRFGRHVVVNQLQIVDGAYEMDFEDLRRRVRDPAVRMAVLCNPHNPVGRVWTRDEVVRFGEICLEEDVLVFSDEIHCDILFNGRRHHPFASLSREFADRSITGSSASKTFNIAGLHHSNTIIPNQRLRRDFSRGLLHYAGYHSPNIFGLVATQAALTSGAPWLDDLLQYLQRNYDLLKSSLEAELPATVFPLEGTYLPWIDFREFGLDPEVQKEILLKKARVALTEGYKFGPGGAGFERINIACPKSVLQTAVDRIAAAFREYC